MLAYLNVVALLLACFALAVATLSIVLNFTPSILIAWQGIFIAVAVIFHLVGERSK